ncbi:MAG TPA: hypothetical protein DCY88_34890 [Cyanobacteria bacterium UBA11372]|nr:hypothetical protein [Cyanobacteria bacterium UBA11372]
MKLNKLLPLAPTALFFVLPAIATDVEPNLLPQTTSGGAIHVRNSTGNGYEVNQIRINRIEYIGDCPGEATYTPKAYFISSSTPPAPGRRVVIRNVSPGIDNDPYPYTDRGYDKGQYSQGFDVSLNTTHQTRDFALKEGVNQFNYEIKEKNTTIESGSFTVEVFRQNSSAISRSQICETVRRCDNYFEIPQIPGYETKPREPRIQNCRWERQCSCPSF